MKITKSLLKSFFCLTLLLFVTGFTQLSDLKQEDEYSCGPVCAANCAVNILNRSFDRDELVQSFTVLARTDKNGTTIQNLCEALEKFFLKTNLKTRIKYYGIRRVDLKYKSRTALNICDELNQGSSVILNLGFYKQDGSKYKRLDGHYVNAYACKDGQILIADPYNKEKTPYYISLVKVKNIKIHNTKDNERYNRRWFRYFKVSPDFDYQNKDETVFLNGIISIFPYYL